MILVLVVARPATCTVVERALVHPELQVERVAVPQAPASVRAHDPDFVLLEGALLGVEDAAAALKDAGVSRLYLLVREGQDLDALAARAGAKALPLPLPPWAVGRLLHEAHEAAPGPAAAAPPPAAVPPSLAPTSAAAATVDPWMARPPPSRVDGLTGAPLPRPAPDGDPPPPAAEPALAPARVAAPSAPSATSVPVAPNAGNAAVEVLQVGPAPAPPRVRDPAAEAPEEAPAAEAPPAPPSSAPPPPLVVAPEAVEPPAPSGPSAPPPRVPEREE